MKAIRKKSKDEIIKDIFKYSLIKSNKKANLKVVKEMMRMKRNDLLKLRRGAKKTLIPHKHFYKGELF